MVELHVVYTLELNTWRLGYYKQNTTGQNSGGMCKPLFKNANNVISRANLFITSWRAPLYHLPMAFHHLGNGIYLDIFQ